MARNAQTEALRYDACVAQLVTSFQRARGAA